MLETTPGRRSTARSSARARRVDERLPARSQQRTLRAIGDDELRRARRAYVDAWERGDVDAVVAMLTEDAAGDAAAAELVQRPRGDRRVLRAPPALRRDRWRLVPTSANGQPARPATCGTTEAAAFTPHCLNVLTLREGRIAEITAFLAPGSFEPYGMPPSVAV